MKLVLAEKPSVAQSIAKVLGATKREDGYLEGNGYVVSWCVGHLVELSQPEAYDEKYNKWAYADLPIFPDQWKYQVSASTKKQFGILKKLMARKDVESLVCATDAGREGELIFRLVYQQAGCRKPFERLWISSMEDSAIREGFEQLKPSTEYDALYEAALCRERADWLVGINATRLFSTLYGQTLNVGRVMTPTLAMVVMREAAISAFRPEPFYTVELAFQDFTASGERMKQKVLADDVARKCVGSVLNVTKAENKEKSEKPPALYDLTSLQRDANRVLGFTAQQTLDYTQSLYEKKLVTYPRTDSRYLTSDMKDMLPELIKSLFNIFPVEDVKNVPVHAAQVINDKKVSDHHAIIPTKEAIKCSLDDLPKGEQAILRLIATRLFCAVGEPFRYNESVIELSDGNYIFSAKGKTTVQSGWKIFSGKPADKDKEGEKQLPSLTVGEGLSVYSTEVKEGKTSPPKHFTEDTLLQSMETAGADEMPEDAERKGLGTPATRAATIEKLVRIGFLERKGDKKTKHLISTHKGTALVTVMPEQIQSPSMTADWEEKLLMIERGEYDSNAFLKEIQDMISALVQTYEKVKGSDVLMAKEVQTVGVCPVCGSSVTERQKGFFCSKRECHFALWKNSRYFESIGKSLTSAVAQKLLSNGEVITGRQQKNDIIAYQIRQSFKPGEITPEEANQVGYETAMRWTKGKHAFIVATHIDRSHIHNHIIYNSTSLDCTRKFKNFFLSGLAVQRLSDMVCIEHGLSIIEPKPYRERVKRTIYPKKRTKRDELCAAIDQILKKKPKDFSDFVFQLSELGYEFKDGKQPAFRHSGEKRFIRLRSLGEGYSQEDIIAILSGKSVQKASRASRQVHTQREFNLLIDIQEKMAEGKSAGYERWAKKYNRKEAARTVCLLKEKGISNYEELTALTEQLSSRFAELSDTIKANEKRMVEIGALQTHINNYSRTRSVYEAYRKSGYSIKFFEEHREEIQIHKAAKKAFDQLPGKKVPTRQSLNEEYHRLLSGKKEAYAEYRQVKKDMQEYLIAKQTVEHILGIDRKNRIITQQQNLD